MANESLEIPISAGNVFTEDPKNHVHGGHSRFVPHVPVGDGPTLVYLPCLWRSHKITPGKDASGSNIAVNECLLLISRDPITTIRGEVAVDAWQHFGTVLIEW